MPDNFYDLIKTIKRTAVEAVEAKKPVNICYGTVLQTSPLKIMVDQKMTLTEAQLVLTRNVTDFTTEVTVDWSTEYTSGGGGWAEYASHAHGIKGRKKIIVHNGLVKGDEVLLLRQQGGQKFIVVDRVT